jgi:murein DD-endopeptidase MepM/ murein hydrolase activator NlpD
MQRKFLSTVFLAAAFCTPAGAQNPDRYLQIKAVQQGDSAVIQAANDCLGPVTITLEATLENMAANPNPPLTVTLQPRSDTTLAVIRRVNPQAKYRFSYKYRSHFGDPAAKHQDDHVYQLPFESQRTHQVIQGYGGAFSHQGDDANSLDFDLAGGDKIMAARAGLVIDTEAGQTAGGNDPKHRNRANYVLVLQADGTIGRYIHLQPGGVKVRVGQKVKAGDLLGLSGNTGYSARPHLHFDVFRPLDGQKSERIQTRFRTATVKAELLEEGKSYQRP